MKYRIQNVLLIAALLLGVSVRAAEAPKPETITLNSQQASLLADGLAKLNGAPSPEAPAAGQVRAVIPFAFNGEFTRIAIFRDCVALETAMDASQKAMQKLIEAANLKYHLAWLPAEKDGSQQVDLTKTKREDAIAGTAEIRSAMALTFDVQLYKLKEDDLNLVSNPIPPTIGVELAPILKIDPPPATPKK